MYGILNTETNELLGFTTTRGGDNCCVDVEFDLCKYEDIPWLVHSHEVAEQARVTNTEWYNRSYETPGNSYAKESDTLRVVAVNLEFKKE